MNACPVSKTSQDVGDRPVFPPNVVVKTKALACELPSESDLPLPRFSHSDIAREAVQRGIVASMSGATVWRWLNADAIKPWSHRSWIFPRDARFAEKAGRVLDLYQSVWEGRPLTGDDCIICADEKTSIQARKRVTPGTAPQPHRNRPLESEYERRGALAYIAAWDVRQARLFGLCHSTTGIQPFRRLVDLVMQQQPYRSAARVFWVTDNGSSHPAKGGALSVVSQRRANSYAHPCQLVEPNRDILLHHTAKGPYPKRLP
jgi:hypothetical protein